eukprot:2869065-Pyramimonas_sp.AAC.1
MEVDAAAVDPAAAMAAAAGGAAAAASSSHPPPAESGPAGGSAGMGVDWRSRPAAPADSDPLSEAPRVADLAVPVD